MKKLLKKQLKKVFVGRYLCALYCGRYGDLKKYVIDASRKLIYINNPKVACSSIKTAIFGEQEDIHEFALSFSQSVLTSEVETYYKFSFVRNPYERLVSCFEDKCIANPAIFNNYQDGYLAGIKDFNQFLKYILLLPDSMGEPHFASQYHLIYDKKGNCLADYIGKIENMRADFEPICQQFNLLPIQRKHQVASLLGRNWMDYYTPLTARLVYWKYRKDFIAFGYQGEYRKLMKYLKSV